MFNRLSSAVIPALATLVLATAAPAAAAPVEGGWSPPPPLPDDFDWVQLDSDEWLKGEIQVMYQDTLEFDSDELDFLQLDWSDLKQIRSASILQVRATGDRMAVGRIVLEDREIRVLGDTETRFSQDEVISVTAGVPREINYWKLKATLGVTARQGNTDQVEASTRVNLQRRTVENRMRLEYLANYTRTNEVETANNHRATFSWDRFVTDRFFLRPLTGEYYRDPFQNLASRVTAGTGVGYQIMDTSKTTWDVSAGPGVRHIRYDEVEAGEPSTDRTWLVFAGTNFSHELRDWIDVIYEYSFQVTEEAAGLYTHHMVGGLEIELTDRLDIDLSVIWDRIEKPQPAGDGTLPEKNDWRYIVGLGWEF